jgi:TRAP-type transport system periplasmic protein
MYSWTMRPRFRGAYLTIYFANLGPRYRGTPQSSHHFRPTCWGEIPAMSLVRPFVGAALAAAILAFSPQARAQEMALRIESNVPAAHATSRAMLIFKDEAARLSKGTIDIEVQADSPRSQKELIDGVHVGSIFGMWANAGYFSRLVPEVQAVSLPFVFANYDEAMRAVAGPAGRLIATKLEAKGFLVLAWMELGELHVSNSKRPLRTIDDLKGLSLRVLPNTTHLATFRAIGARPVAMDFQDVGTALRQGDVDGQELDYGTLYATKFYESQKYLSDSRHFLDFHFLIVNKTAFAGLDPKQQQTIRQAAATAAVQQRKISTEIHATALERLKAAGVQFDPLPAETRAALRRATAGVIDDVRKSVGADVVNKLLAANRVSVPDNGQR